MHSITVSRGLPIGEASNATGINIETMRYYERIGMVPKPHRTSGRHRLYDADQIRRLTFIRRARELGFPLEDIRGLLALMDEDDFTCAQVNEIAVTHLQEIHKKIEDLRHMEKALKQITAKCDLGETPDCPIVDTLNRQAA